MTKDSKVKKKARKLAEEQGISYTEARRKVLAKEGEDAERWLDEMDPSDPSLHVTDAEGNEVVSSMEITDEQVAALREHYGSSSTADQRDEHGFGKHNVDVIKERTASMMEDRDVSD